MDQICSISFFAEKFMEIGSFWQMAAFKSKIQEMGPHLKLNFTTITQSPLPLWTILLLGNGIGLVVVLLLHISTL